MEGVMGIPLTLLLLALAVLIPSSAAQQLCGGGAGTPSCFDDTVVCYITISNDTEECIYHPISGYNCTFLNTTHVTAASRNISRCENHGVCYVNLGIDKEVCYYLLQYGYQCGYKYEAKVIQGMNHCDHLKSNSPPEIILTINTQQARTTLEDTPLTMAFVSIEDADAKDSEAGELGDGYLLVRLTATRGKVQFNPSAAMSPTTPTMISNILNIPADAVTPSHRAQFSLPSASYTSGYQQVLEFLIRTAPLETLMTTLQFLPDLNWNNNNHTVASLLIYVDDRGNTGGTPEHTSKTIQIFATAVNDPPAVTMPYSFPAFLEDHPFNIPILPAPSIVVSDVDFEETADAKMRLTITVSHGNLSITGGGLTQASSCLPIGSCYLTISNDGRTLDAQSSMRDLQQHVLNALRYTPHRDYNGNDTLTVTVNDNGYTGGLVGLTATGSSWLLITPDNDAPYFLDPAGTFTVLEDNILNIPGGSIRVDDVDDTYIAIYVAVHNGTLNVNASDDTFYHAPRSLSRSRLSLAEANAFLDSLRYHPDLNFFGQDQLYIQIDDSPSHGGQALKSSITHTIEVTPVNDPPVIKFKCPTKCPRNTFSGNLTSVDTITTYMFLNNDNSPTIWVEDVDAFSEPIQILISSDRGEFLLSHDTPGSLPGVSYTIPSAYTGPSNTFLLLGSQYDLNRALNDGSLGLRYRRTSSGTFDEIILAANDLLHTGAGNPGTDFKIIRVNNVNQL